MKIAVFHGWGSTSKDNWFPWLKNELEKKGHEVFCPDLPDTEFPDQDKWLKKAMEFKYDENTILVGHSSGSVLILHLLMRFKVKAAYLVSAFLTTLGIDDIKALFKTEFDYEKIKSNAEKIVIMNSDDDPYIPLENVQDLQKKLDSSMIIFEKMEHLSAGTDNFKFPELLSLIENENSN